jgi:hypothetical protein
VVPSESFGSRQESCRPLYSHSRLLESFWSLQSHCFGYSSPSTVIQVSSESWNSLQGHYFGYSSPFRVIQALQESFKSFHNSLWTCLFLRALALQSVFRARCWCHRVLIKPVNVGCVREWICRMSWHVRTRERGITGFCFPTATVIR